ncbi:unnamed protein product [Phaeothamnion confervicola]
MQQEFNIGIKTLCGLFGKTRHAYYDREWSLKAQTVEYAIILKLVEEQRRLLPRAGTPKVLNLIQGSLSQHEIKIGVKKLHHLLAEYGLTVRRKRRRTVTTFSKHWLKKYSNLIKDVKVQAPEEIWVADITYVALRNGFSHLPLITDAYSRKIVGYCLHPTLEHCGPLRALKDAIDQRQYPEKQIIHHSDRGIQYCCGDYIKCLREANFMISMPEKGDPYENAIAERVNGILKDEFDLDRVFEDHQQALIAVNRIITLYNNHRPHASCDFLTPEKAHQLSIVLRKRWKTGGRENWIENPR